MTEYFWIATACQLRATKAVTLAVRSAELQCARCVAEMTGAFCACFQFPDNPFVNDHGCAEVIKARSFFVLNRLCLCRAELTLHLCIITERVFVVGDLLSLAQFDSMRHVSRGGDAFRNGAHLV